jgi:hypothetical protein
MADARLYSYAILNRRLHQLLHGIFGEAVASTLSWHYIRSSCGRLSRRYKPTNLSLGQPGLAQTVSPF